MPSLDDINLQRLLDLEGNLTHRNFDEFIEFVRIHYRLASIGYTCSAFPGRHPNEPFLTLTYCDPSVAESEAERDPIVDAVRDIGTRSVDPLDWASFRRFETKAKRLLNVVQEPRKTQGLTIPVRGPAPGISALFSVTSHDSDAEWSARRYDLMRDMVHVAHFVHQKAYELNADADRATAAEITRSEIEVLQWASEGLQPEDIGFAMRISVETVKALLDSARYKLRALNRTHAVGKAIRAGLIR